MDSANDTPKWPTKIIPHFGQAVRGEMRFPRPELEAEFDSVLTRSNGARLFGLRRTGKSSEAVACAERLRKLGKKVIEEDVQGTTSEVGLLYAILQRFSAQGFGDRILQFISGDNSISLVARKALEQFSPTMGDVQAYFSPISAAIQRALQDTKEEIVLVIDEFPWLCRNILEADAHTGRNRVNVLFAELRKWRGVGVKMFLMGSIGLTGLGREYRLDLSHFTDLLPLSVPPLEHEEAEALVRALAAGGNITGWTDDHTHALLDESAAFYSSLLQRGFQQVAIGGKAAALTRFPDIFAEKVRPDLDAAFFQQFDTRVHRYAALGEPLPRILPRLLETVLTSATPVTYETLSTSAGEQTDAADLGDALSILREDGFLTPRIEKNGYQTWRAASTLVTAWRNQRRGGARL